MQESLKIKTNSLGLFTGFSLSNRWLRKRDSGDFSLLLWVSDLLSRWWFWNHEVVCTFFHSQKEKRCWERNVSLRKQCPLGKFPHSLPLSSDTFPSICSFWYKILFEFPPTGLLARANLHPASGKAVTSPPFYTQSMEKRERLDLCLLCLLRLVLILTWGLYGATAVGSCSGWCLGSF